MSKEKFSRKKPRVNILRRLFGRGEARAGDAPVPAGEHPDAASDPTSRASAGGQTGGAHEVGHWQPSPPAGGAGQNLDVSWDVAEYRAGDPAGSPPQPPASDPPAGRWRPDILKAAEDDPEAPSGTPGQPNQTDLDFARQPARKDADPQGVAKVDALTFKMKLVRGASRWLRLARPHAGQRVEGKYYVTGATHRAGPKGPGRIKVRFPWLPGSSRGVRFRVNDIKALVSLAGIGATVAGAVILVASPFGDDSSRAGDGPGSASPSSGSGAAIASSTPPGVVATPVASSTASPTATTAAPAAVPTATAPIRPASTPEPPSSTPTVPRGTVTAVPTATRTPAPASTRTPTPAPTRTPTPAPTRTPTPTRTPCSSITCR